jgi:hypothetical protein
LAPERKMRRLICESRPFIVLDKRSCLSLLRRRSIQLLRQAPAQNKTAMLRTARASLKSLEKSSAHEPRVGFRWAAALIPQRLARLRGAFVSRSRHRLRRTADHRTEAERSQGLRYKVATTRGFNRPQRSIGQRPDRQHRSATTIRQERERHAWPGKRRTCSRGKGEAEPLDW